MRCCFCRCWWFTRRLYKRAVVVRGKPRSACRHCLKVQGLRRRH
jgi:hypothetical protein